MPAKHSTVRAPLTFDLSESLLKKVDDYRRKAGFASNSEVIRNAIQQYDFSGYRSDDKAHRQISVRIDSAKKQELLRMARQKKTSVGELLRAALEGLSEPPAQAGGAKTAKKGKMVKKQARKKTATKKAATKKAATKKAAKKKAVKKTARKTVARTAKKVARAAKKTVKKVKRTAKKTAKKVKRVAKKKTAARKAVKKTAAKKTAAKKTAKKKSAAKKAKPKKKTARKKR